MTESGVLPDVNPDQSPGHGAALAATARSDGRVDLWDLVTGLSVGEPLTGHDGPVLGVAFSPNGRLLASAGNDRTVRLWNPATGRPAGALLRGHHEAVEAVAFAGDGLLVSAGREGKIRLHDLGTGRRARRSLRHSRGLLAVGAGALMHIDGDPAIAMGADGPRILGIRTAAVSADGRVLASGAYDGTVRLWDLAARHRIGGRFGAHYRMTTAVALSPDGRLLATGGAEGWVKLWDTATRHEVVPPLTRHVDTVTALAFSPDGKLMASGGDWAIRLFDTVSGQLLPSPPDTGSVVRGLAFGAGGRMLAIATRRGDVRLWDLATRQYSGDLKCRDSYSLWGIAVTGSIAPTSLPPSPTAG